MKRKYLLVIAAAALVSGCARNDVHDNINDAVLETESKEDIKPLKSGTLELFRAFDEGFDEYIFSPEMLRKNFYTVANYADGDTKQDIETVFNFPDAYNDNDTITKNKDINCFSRTYINRSKMEEAKLSELSDGKIIPMGITMEELDNEKTKLNEMAEDVIESFPHDFINEYSGISMLHYVRFNKPLAVPCESNLSQIEEGARVDYFISGYTSNLNIKESEDKTINILRLPFVTNDGEDQFSLYLFCDALNSNQMGVSSYIKKLTEEEFNNILDFRTYDGLLNSSKVYFNFPTIDAENHGYVEENVKNMNLITPFNHPNKDMKALGENGVSHVYSDVRFHTYITGIEPEEETDSADTIIHNVNITTPFIYVVKNDNTGDILIMGKKNPLL